MALLRTDAWGGVELHPPPIPLPNVMFHQWLPLSLSLLRRACVCYQSTHSSAILFECVPESVQRIC